MHHVRMSPWQRVLHVLVFCLMGLAFSLQAYLILLWPTNQREVNPKIALIYCLAGALGGGALGLCLERRALAVDEKPRQQPPRKRSRREVYFTTDDVSCPDSVPGRK